MSFRLFRNFIAWWLLAFGVLAIWHLYTLNLISLSHLDIGIDAAAALFITLVHFAVCRMALVAPGGRSPRPRLFLAQICIRLLGVYLVLAGWSGASYELMHHSLTRQDLRAILITNFPAAPIAIIFLFWIVFSEWWYAYVYASKTQPILSTPVIPAAPVAGFREKPAFLTLDINPRR